jgi:hypothetical protein
MSNVTKTISTVHKLVETIPAANADQIGEGFGGQTTVAATETSTGWDSYEVWRRFIKDARDRRRAGT